MQNFQELNDEELETVVGGSHHHSSHSSHTDAQVNVQANANGGYLNINKVITRTKSVSITADGESVSTVVGFGIAIAI